MLVMCLAKLQNINQFLYACVFVNDVYTFTEAQWNNEISTT